MIFRDEGIADTIGAILLISIVAIGISVVGLSVLSQPPPQKVPALGVEITAYDNAIQIRHEGGDPLYLDSSSIIVDGTDLKNAFLHLDGTSWSVWSVGDSLYYVLPAGQALPLQVQVVHNIGGNSQVIQTLEVPPSNGITLPPIIPLTTITATTIPTQTTSPVQPAPVAADFSGLPLSLSLPLPVQFNDASTGPVTLWFWNFGDGGTSTTQSPSHTYSTVGTYTVSLTVSNGTGSSTNTKTNYITVNLPVPVASFTAAPLSGTAPLSVSLTDTSTNSPTSWKWSFRNSSGNNTPTTFSTNKDPVLLFGVGNYSIVLNASNSQGFNVSSQVTFVNVSRPFSGLSYYRNVAVASSPAIADYQMRVTVPYSAHMKTDFGDIRFTGTDGTTAYNYWMESKADGSSAIFWVNVPSAGTTLFRMYYGNTSLTSTSDGTATFDFFDDFSGGLGKWVVEKPVGVYPRIENGYLVAGGGFTTGTYGHTSLGSSPTYNGFQDGIIEFSHQNAPDGICEVVFRGDFAQNLGYKGRWDARSGDEQVFLMPPYYGWDNIGDAVTKWNMAGPWYRGKVVIHGNMMDLYDDDDFKGSVSDDTYASAGEIALQNHYGSYTNFDDIRVRKYAATEPLTTLGIENTA